MLAGFRIRVAYNGERYLFKPKVFDVLTYCGFGVRSAEMGKESR